MTRYKQIEGHDFGGGVDDARGFHLAHSIRPEWGVIGFAIWKFGPRDIGVFLDEEDLSAERRAKLRAEKPEWLSEIVFADNVPMVEPGVPTLEIETAPDADAEACAFAAACTAQATGSYRFVPSKILVRVNRRQWVVVRQDFDWDVGEYGSWFGETELQSSD
jgi:hypothetical protein